jgi:Mrp family chromosome partitioning ATPase
MAEEHVHDEVEGPPAPTPGMHPSFMRVIQQRQRVKEKLSNIKHKIGVYSAKGGVGKTTIAINLAYTLMKEGFKVGLLDADIDCPNITLFLNINEKMDPHAPLHPIEKDGIKIASTAMLVDEVKRPIIWRGPIVTKMLGDLFEHTDWGPLDYLIIDLSPGTSDSPLTIMQLLELDGFIIVTTPQKIAAVNSVRSGLMAKRLGAHVLGVVENMSDGTPSSETLDVVSALQTELLGFVKANDLFNKCSDAGKVPVMEDKATYDSFKDIVKKITA